MTAPEQTLVLEAAPGARDLVRHHARGRFSRSLAAEAGRSLARLHAVPPEALGGVAPLLPAAPPHRPDLGGLRTLSGAAIELTRIVQRSDEFCAELDELLASPPPAVAVVHGDVRWGNCIALRQGSRRWGGLQLVDWELCGTGDPAVDVGAFIGEYLRAWIGSMPSSRSPRSGHAARPRPDTRSGGSDLPCRPSGPPTQPTGPLRRRRPARCSGGRCASRGCGCS